MEQTIESYHIEHATETLWREMVSANINSPHAIEAFTGRTPKLPENIFFSDTQQAQEFVQYVPSIRRELVLTQVQETEVNFGQPKGQIVWGQTAKYQGSRPEKTIFVTRVTQRTYNSFENQTLVAALEAIRSSVPLKTRRTQPQLEAVKTAQEAQKLLSVNPLRDVTVLGPQKLSFAIKKTLQSKKYKLYRPAIELLEINKQHQRKIVSFKSLDIHNNDSANNTHKIVLMIHKTLQELGHPRQQLLFDGNVFHLGLISFRVGTKGFVSCNGITFKMEPKEKEFRFDPSQNLVVVAELEKIPEMVVQIFHTRE